MAIFNFLKKEKKDPDLKYVGNQQNPLQDRTGRSGSPRSVTKKVYKSIKKTLQIDRRYEPISAPATLKSIANAYHIEGFLRRSISRYVELIWKNGYEISSNNKKAHKYIKNRLKQIAYVTDKPTELLLDDIAAQLVKYFNCFIVKARNKKASGGNIRTTFYGKRLLPVAGYFIVEPYRMLARRDRDTKVIKYWEHYDSNGVKIKEYKPEDVIHITMDRAQNTIFSSPPGGNVLDDIRALRRIEENVEVLIFQHAIPLYHYKVGTEEDGPLEGEVESMRYKIENMVAEGMLITDGRHSVDAIGVRTSALDVSPYLEYYRQRIIIGLGQSESSIGLGDASRSSAGMINKQILDATRRFQRRIQSHIELFIINELLEEGGFDTFDSKNEVNFFIPEIDLDDRIRKEFHITSLWQSNLYTEDEARAAIGKDPYDKTQFENTFFNRITIPRIRAEAEARALSHLETNNNEGEKIGAPGTTPETEQKIMPRNQYGQKRRSGEPQRGTDIYYSSEVKDNIKKYRRVLHNHFEAIRDDIVSARKDGYEEPEETNLMISKPIVIGSVSKLIVDSFMNGLKQANILDLEGKHENSLRRLHGENEKLIQNLFNDTTILLREYKNHDPLMVFDGIDFKVKLLSSWIIQKAYNLALALSYKDKGVDLLHVIRDSIGIYDIEVDDIEYDNVPPYDYDDVYKMETLING